MNELDQFFGEIRSDALLFDAVCDEQVFSLKSWKKLAQISSCHFEKNLKNALLIPKNDFTEPRLGYSNNQLILLKFEAKI